MPDPVTKKFIGLLVLIGGLVWLWLGIRPGPSQICFRENCFGVELARSRAEQARGLSFRKSLAPDRAMLFIFNQSGEYPFWMKNTLIPLDIIWLDEKKEIVTIKENALPCRENDCFLFYPDKKSRYVLEVNAGLVKKLGLVKGEMMEFK